MSLANWSHILPPPAPPVPAAPDARFEARRVLFLDQLRRIAEEERPKPAAGAAAATPAAGRPN